MRSDLVYQGRYRTLSLGLLAQAIPLYSSILKHLGKYGVGLNNLRWETAVLADTNLTIHLLDLNAMFRIRLDRLEANFFKLHEVSIEAAHRMLVDLAAVVQEVDVSLGFGQHEFNIGFDANILNTGSRDFFKRYVTLSSSLQQARPGLILSMDGDGEQGLQAGSLVIVPMPSQEQGLTVRISGTFNADQVPLGMLRQRGEEYANRLLTALDLAVEGPAST